jgi:UDP-N-acetylglucosamine--N-acetylmuramyl-(pentapeptide) pyrophosphoryl-undecaprenol N-acetylglucosamine transferase
MKKYKTVILAAGGTGGHLFPATAVADQLNLLNVKTHLITDLRCLPYLPVNLTPEKHIIDIHLKMRGLINKIRSLLRLTGACIKALLLVNKIKPDAIVGFGGYPSFPALIAAKILKIPIIIHEQNCFLGKSNRIFAKDAKIIALSYKETANIENYDDKTIIIGDIVRSEIENISSQYQPDSKIFNLFICGGSQGAKIFSTLIPKAIKKLVKTNPNIKIHITQQALTEDQQQLKKEYLDLGIDCKISGFFHNIVEIYSNSQLVIARSGAGTIAELTHIGVPAIFIPLPSAADDHQFYNAKAIAESNASWCYKQENITCSILANKLSEIINDRKILSDFSLNLLKRKNTGAAARLADTVCKIIT